MMDKEDKKRERMRKRCKLLKPFREYTARNHGEGSFKGWSKRAADDMAACCKKLKEEKAEMVRFRKAYRDIYQDQNKKKRKSIEVKVVDVDYSELWDVDDVQPIEI